MRHGKLLRIGGYVSGGVLILFGIVVIALGIWGISFTRDNLKEEGIVFEQASDPAVAEHAERWAGEPVETGSQALASSPQIMREPHASSSTGGLYVRADGPLPVVARRTPGRERGGGRNARGGSREGRRAAARLERRPQHLGHRDRADYGSEHRRSCPRCSRSSASSWGSRCC